MRFCDASACEDALCMQVSQAGPSDSLVRFGDSPMDSQRQAVVLGKLSLGLREQLGLESPLVLVDVVDVVGLKPSAEAGREPAGKETAVAKVQGELEVDNVRSAGPVDEDVARLVQVEVDEVSRVDLTDGGRQPVEKVLRQCRPLAQVRAFDVRIDVGVRMRAGQHRRDLSDAVASPEIADLFVGHQPAQPVEWNEAEVLAAVGLADEFAGQVGPGVGRLVEPGSRHEVVLQDAFEFVLYAQTAYLPGRTLIAAGVETPAEPPSGGSPDRWPGHVDGCRSNTASHCRNGAGMRRSPGIETHLLSTECRMISLRMVRLRRRQVKRLARLWGACVHEDRSSVREVGRWSASGLGTIQGFAYGCRPLGAVYSEHGSSRKIKVYASHVDMK